MASAREKIPCPGTVRTAYLPGTLHATHLCASTQNLNLMLYKGAQHATAGMCTLLRWREAVSYTHLRAHETSAHL
eukprot:14204217-Alexandrium_andersonii.AAC.1